ncbi:MAG: S8 family serine peptidase [Candidatus Binatia bacterium]
MSHVQPASAAPLAAYVRARMLNSGVVGSAAVEAFAVQEKVRVMIAFAVPNPEINRSEGRHAAAFSMRAAIDAVRTNVLSTLAPADFELRHAFLSVNAVAGDITPSGILALLDHPNVLRIDLDEGGSGGVFDPIPLVHLDVLHAMGLTGQGVTAAVLDTGIDTSHPDLADDVVAEQCFCSSLSGIGGCCPDGAATQNGAGSAEDDNGHGTNVSGILTSNGTIAPAGGAPDTKIVAVKVLDRNNRFCCSSDVIAGLDWIINNRPDVKVVNMSLGTSALFSGDCDTATADTIAFATAIDTLRAQGISTFAASLNDGSGSEMSAPACVKNAVSVGAVYNADVGRFTFADPPHPTCTDSTTHADEVTCFSNSDSTTDVFAPGCPTTSTGLGGGVSTFCGTSQATPLVAACAACLLQADPSAAPDQLELALKTSPTLVTAPQNGLSFPRLDCAAALAALTGVTPTSTPAATPTNTPTPARTVCTGDCNGNAVVTVDEILRMVNIALGNEPLSDCEAGDANGDGSITIDEILTAVDNALNGCGPILRRLLTYASA